MDDPGVGQEGKKMILQYLAVPESKEVFTVWWGVCARATAYG